MVEKSVAAAMQPVKTLVEGEREHNLKVHESHVAGARQRDETYVQLQRETAARTEEEAEKRRRFEADEAEKQRQHEATEAQKKREHDLALAQARQAPPTPRGPSSPARVPVTPATTVAVGSAVTYERYGEEGTGQVTAATPRKWRIKPDDDEGTFLVDRHRVKPLDD